MNQKEYRDLKLTQMIANIVDLIEAVIRDKVTYPESGDYLSVQNAKRDLQESLTEFVMWGQE